VRGGAGAGVCRLGHQYRPGAPNLSDADRHQSKPPETLRVGKASQVTRLVQKLYRFLFARSYFFKLNSFLHILTLNGMGIMNWESSEISGEANFLRRILGKDTRVIVDIGAHSGAYIRDVQQLAPAARIFGFEPHPITYSRLQGHGWQTNITLVNQGVGSKAGMMTLYDYAGDDGSEHASLLQGVIETIHMSRAVEHRVEVVTLDDFTSQHGIDYIDLLKVDTEGNELDVLHGATKLIANKAIGVIQFEFNAMNVISRSFLSDFMKLLQGYKFYRLLPQGCLEIARHDARLHEIFAFQNIVAIVDGNPKAKLMSVK
jgi:FkbM family methyltransferase